MCFFKMTQGQTICAKPPETFQLKKWRTEFGYTFHKDTMNTLRGPSFTLEEPKPISHRSNHAEGGGDCAISALQYVLTGRRSSG